MRKLLILCTHIGSGSNQLCNSLGKNKRIHWLKENIIYSHPTIVSELIHNNKHKYNQFSGLYLNEVTYNLQMPHQGVFSLCEFIFMVREPRKSLLFQKNPYYMVNHYIFRLRRIYEMTKMVDKAIFLTWDDCLKGSLNQLKQFYELDELNLEEEPLPRCELPKDLLKQAETAYELLLFRINKNSNILRL